MTRKYRIPSKHRLSQFMCQWLIVFGHGFTSVFLVLMVITMLSCDEVEDPLEELPPDTLITLGPENGSVLTEPPVTFQWTGSNEFVGEFSYRCSPYQEEWSEWSSGRSVTLYLDEGQYVFEVRGRYEPENEDDTPTQRVFSVDFLEPGMLLKPFKQEVLLDQEFFISVVVHEVEDVMLAHLILEFEPADLHALDAVPGGVFQAGKLPVFFRKIDNSEGIVDINISTVGAKPSRLNGTGEVALISFRSLSPSESRMLMDSGSELRDSKNKAINTISRLGSVVEIAAE